MADHTHGVWGIDLGQCALKAIRLEEIDGELTATAFDYVEHPKILSQPDADPDELTREALTKFLERNNLRGDLVAISVPGQSGLARFVKLPPVEEKKIADIVRFEAKQQIPFNLDEVVWDYQKIGSGTVTDGFAMETEIGLFAMKRDMIGRYLQHFRDVNVEVQLVQMAPLALCNYVAYDLLGKGARVEGEEAEKTGCVVCLDIGADSSNLVITDGDRVIWQRPIPLGGNHFTRALTKEMKLTFAKAEHLKRNATKSPDLKKILSSLKPVLNDFVGEVQRSLGYFTNTHRNAQIDYMVGMGNAFRLPGLQKYLGEKLQLEVRKVTKMQRLSGEAVVTAPTYTENILSYGVAYGLALQGIKQSRILTNLLPGEIRTERLVKAKKPWAAAAAAVFLLGIAAMSAKAFWGDTRPWGAADDKSNPVSKAIEDSTTVNGRVASANKAFTEAKENADKEARAVKSIVAGQDEQLNWIDLMKFVSEVIPRPDGSNLPPTAKKEYWETTANQNSGHPNLPLALNGQQAWNLYKKDLAAGTKPASGAEEKNDEPRLNVVTNDPLGRGIDDRVQFNVEMVNARYTPDLAVFWDRVSKNVGEKNLKEAVRPLDNSKNPPTAPTGKGWIVEVHGYTFNYRKGFFVKATLMENIVRMGMPAAAATPPDAPGVPPVPPVPPAAPGVAPVVPGAPEVPAGEKKEDPDPVHNRISHVVLYKVFDSKTNDSTTFTLIKTSVLPELLGASAGTAGSPAGGGLGGPMMPGGPLSPSSPTGGAPGGTDTGSAAPAASPRDSWTPLGSIGGGASSSGLKGEGSAGRPAGMPGPGGIRPGGVGPEGPGGTPKGTTVGKGILHDRTEFVILFIWKEPTPSDSLRDMEETVAPKQ